MSHIVVEPSGTIKQIYEDDLRGLLATGKTEIKRVSHVEPTVDGRWEADLSPVNGPVLGPYDTRKEALDAEVAYLIHNVL
jgi:hypothetical protein